MGDYYLRLFLESGEASVTNLRDPGRFFDALYRRVLRENAPNLKCMCLRGMTRVYEKHSATIGSFEDTDYVVFLLSQTQHAEVRQPVHALPSSSLPRSHRRTIAGPRPPAPPAARAVDPSSELREAHQPRLSRAPGRPPHNGPHDGP